MYRIETDTFTLDLSPEIYEQDFVYPVNVNLGVRISSYGYSADTYCYANTNAALVRENMKQHDPKSPFLIGNSLPGDAIHEAEQKSWLDLQMRLEI